MYSKSMSDSSNHLLYSQMLVTQQCPLSKQLYFKSYRCTGKSSKEGDLPHSLPAKAALDVKFFCCMNPKAFISIIFSMNL